MNMLKEGQEVVYRGQICEVIRNDFTGKLALDNEYGQVSLDSIDLDEVSHQTDHGCTQIGSAGHHSDHYYDDGHCIWCGMIGA